MSSFQTIKQMDTTSASPIRLTPFLKWPGGKRWLVGQHSEWFEGHAGRHIEPFLGGAAAFFYSRPRRAILSDSNADLISTYETVRDSPTEIERLLLSHQSKHSSEYYYQTRRSVPTDPLEKAGRFIYLNRTCFNGLFRVNLKGTFNVPIGSKTNVVLPDDDFLRISEALAGVDLRSRDFGRTISLTRREDFLYADPPYTVQHNNNNFVKYNERIFSWADQIRLSERLLSAARRGVRVLMSNADHPSVRGLYSDRIWTRLSISRRSVLASNPDKRTLTTELVVSNFLNAHGQIVETRTE